LLESKLVIPCWWMG